MCVYMYISGWIPSVMLVYVCRYMRVYMEIYSGKQSMDGVLSTVATLGGCHTANESVGVGVLREKSIWKEERGEERGVFLCYKEDERTSIDSYATLRYATLYVLRYVLMLHYQRHCRTPQIDPYCTLATYTIPHEANPINSDPIQPKRLTEGSPRRDKNKQKQTKQTNKKNRIHLI